ncbi:hypothetical protein scyTo_0026868 [Scyliorhinus torazame]|uniref:Scaffolding anchor of CK1 domain-containing protein n=1 Tax=Scyliorhinus torazame TaxID=75743 RepID=A0A401QLN1_SCYTO|nr:hypothetical protein [Scyliorhinus torazame]
MAASQVECLEDDNINVQLSECYPQFIYSERQRLALEALLDKGPGAFYQCVKREGTRPFLSGQEARRIHGRCGRASAAEATRPGLEATGDEDSELDQELSLTYWPVMSEAQAPFLTLGWPEIGMWKGITRATVYTHPSMENMPSIKEVIRKLLQQAKQVGPPSVRTASNSSRRRPDLCNPTPRTPLDVERRLLREGQY